MVGWVWCFVGVLAGVFLLGVLGVVVAVVVVGVGCFCFCVVVCVAVGRVSGFVVGCLVVLGWVRLGWLVGVGVGGCGVRVGWVCVFGGFCVFVGVGFGVVWVLGCWFWLWLWGSCVWVGWLRGGWCWVGGCGWWFLLWGVLGFWFLCCWGLLWWGGCFLGWGLGWCWWCGGWVGSRRSSPRFRWLPFVLEWFRCVWVGRCWLSIWCWSVRIISPPVKQ
ncbi:hypothetical protein, partial [Pseudomonas syringae group genomosp. 7]|uniref:hypothetical protein n=1 Tax=Pseudomonas syringae group genomosp. 7 TaxID=251699 RepID=UPI00377071DB